MSRTEIQPQDVAVGPKALEGVLRLPQNPIGLVVFAHGAGSSHRSVRNNYVAEELGKRRLATLLFDLLTEEEARDRKNVFDTPLLSERLIEAIAWVRSDPDIPSLPVGLFGSSTGAAAALEAAAHDPQDIGAVVSRGGRADMAERALPGVKAPVLLIVGERDYQVLELNRAAARLLTCDHRLEVVPQATHLFEEPGALEKVVYLTGAWFETHLSKVGADQ